LKRLSAMPRVIFQREGKPPQEVEGNVGESILALAWRLNLEIEGDCEGSMACSTCHVILEEHDFDRLPPPSEEEDSLLDLVPGVSATSRLGCQIVLTADDDGLMLKLPNHTQSLL
jgi:ferredoxin